MSIISSSLNSSSEGLCIISLKSPSDRGNEDLLPASPSLGKGHFRKESRGSLVCSIFWWFVSTCYLTLHCFLFHTM
jgi:hypothetical protein